MQLPESDEDYLRAKEYEHELVPVGSEGCLIIKNYPVSDQLFNRSSVDLMIRIPAQYNNAALDMFYCDPELRLKESGAYPQAAEVFEEHAGRRWQRFSRHFPPSAPWQAGIDGLPKLLTFVQRELRPSS